MSAWHGYWSMKISMKIGSICTCITKCKGNADPLSLCLKHAILSGCLQLWASWRNFLWRETPSTPSSCQYQPCSFADVDPETWIEKSASTSPTYAWAYWFKGFWEYHWRGIPDSSWFTELQRISISVPDWHIIQSDLYATSSPSSVSLLR